MKDLKSIFNRIVYKCDKYKQYRGVEVDAKTRKLIVDEYLNCVGVKTKGVG